MLTYAQLQRDARDGKISLEIVERYGKTGDEIPERLRGTRHVVGAMTKGIKIQNADGQISELRIDSAKLCEYDAGFLSFARDVERPIYGFLTIYNAGTRPMNDTEKAVWQEMTRIYEKYQDSYSGGFWQAQEYARKSPCPWMAGEEVCRGKKRMYGENGIPYILDNSIKGDAILRYRVYMNEE